MSSSTVTVSRRARIAMDALDPDERAQVERAIRSLEDAPPAARISLRDDLFLLRASPTMRLIYRQQRPDRAEVMDILPRETLQWYRALGAGEVADEVDAPTAR